MATRRYKRKASVIRSVKKILLNRKVWPILLTCAAVAFLSVAGTVLWWSRDLPDPQKIQESRVGESTKIYDSSGTHLLYEIGEARRTYAPLDNISSHIINATLAAEDDQFYEHRGIALSGIVRATLTNLRRGTLRGPGGSTITQQLIKNSLLSPEKTMKRKAKEAVLAIELEQRFSKDEILEMYLNAIPYGSRSYGIEAAAQTFFGTSAQNVSLAQAAILAALPNAPTFYSPYGSHVDRLKARQEHIINRMALLGMVTEEEAERAKEEEFVFQQATESIQAPHFVFYVKDLLEREYGERIVGEGGLKVITTLDMRLHLLAEEVLKENQQRLNGISASNAAITAINPNNGDILAMAGSIDYFNEEIDGNVNIAIRHRSPGSSIKPFVYAAAFQKGYAPETILVDAETDFGQGYTPRNYDLQERGPVTMRASLANSLNITAVKTLYLAGVKTSTELAQKMGMESLNDPDRYGLSLVLGGGEVRLLDITSAYGVFANEGVRHPHRAILKVETSKEVLFDITDKEPSGTLVLDEQTARLTTDVLADNNARALTFGTNSHLQLGSRPVAAKTGTTQEFRDAWAAGYTPSLAVGVWAGNNDNTPMDRGAAGAMAAAPVWNAFMRRALEGTPIEQFTKPEPVTGLAHGILRGELPEVKGKWVQETETLHSLECPVAIGSERAAKELRSILYYVQKDNPKGDAPSRADSDPQFASWEKGVATWREKHNEKHRNNPEEPLYFNSLPVPECSVENEEDLPQVTIVEPGTAIIRESTVQVRAEVDSPRPIREVRFLLEGEEVARRQGNEPYETTLSFPPDLSGRRTLLVMAITEDRLIGRASRVLIINPDENPPEAILHTPFNNTTVTKNDFPLEVKITATDSDSGIDFVDVVYRKAGETRGTTIKRTSTISPLGPNRYDIMWEEAPPPGTYELFVVAYDKSGNTSESSKHTITVTE